MMRPSEIGERQSGINEQPPAAADPLSTRVCSRSSLAAAFSGCGLFTPIVKFVIGVGFTPSAA